MELNLNKLINTTASTIKKVFKSSKKSVTTSTSETAPSIIDRLLRTFSKKPNYQGRISIRGSNVGFSSPLHTNYIPHLAYNIAPWLGVTFAGASMLKNLYNWAYSRLDAISVTDNYKKLLELDPVLKKKSNMVLAALRYISKANPELLLDLANLHRAVLMYIQHPMSQDFVSFVASYRPSKAVSFELSL